jgi:uncharacterized protein
MKAREFRMAFSYTYLAVLGGAGIAAGFINTMAGGGSLLTLPALMLYGLPADVANGSNRSAVVVQSISGVLAFHRRGQLATKSLGKLIFPMIVGSLAGALIASFAPKFLLKPTLLGTMLLMAVAMVVRPQWLSSQPTETSTEINQPRVWLGMFLAGLYGGFVQAGVGFVLLAVLSGMLHYNLVKANALKMLCTLLFGCVSLSVFVIRGQVQWLPGSVVGLGTIVGSQIGVRFAIRAQPKVLRWLVFAGVVVTCVAAIVKR